MAPPMGCPARIGDTVNFTLVGSVILCYIRHCLTPTFNTVKVVAGSERVGKTHRMKT